MNPEINWQPTTQHYSLNSPNQVELVRVGQYELIAFDLRYPSNIGWKIYAGSNFHMLVTNGTAPDFAAAKAAAEAAWRTIKDIHPETLRKPVTVRRRVP